MLIAKPIEDKAEQEKVCAACGAVYDADALAFAAREDDALIGVCQFKFGAPSAEILDLKPAVGVEDYEGMFILARGTLNFIDLCGTHRAHCAADAGDGTLLRAVGFREVDKNRLEMDLAGEFDGKCSHCKS